MDQQPDVLITYEFLGSQLTQVIQAQSRLKFDLGRLKEYLVKQLESTWDNPKNKAYANQWREANVAMQGLELLAPYLSPEEVGRILDCYFRFDNVRKAVCFSKCIARIFEQTDSQHAACKDKWERLKLMTGPGGLQRIPHTEKTQDWTELHQLMEKEMQ